MPHRWERHTGYGTACASQHAGRHTHDRAAFTCCCRLHARAASAQCQAAPASAALRATRCIALVSERARCLVGLAALVARRAACQPTLRLAASKPSLLAAEAITAIGRHAVNDGRGRAAHATREGALCHERCRDLLPTADLDHRQTTSNCASLLAASTLGLK